MNKTEQEYLKDVSRLEEDKKILLAKLENWETEQKASIKTFKELEKTNENLNLSIKKQEEEREKDQEKINQLKERVKELTDRNKIKELTEIISNKDKVIEAYISSENKNKENLWKKDRELDKSTEYLKRLNELVSSKDKEIKNLEEWKKQMPLYQQKITDLENALINLAKQKISNNQDWNMLLLQLKGEWDQEREMILNSAERGRDEQAEEIVALEKENMALVAELEKDDKELEEQDLIILKKDKVIEDLKWQLTQSEQQNLIIGDIDKLLNKPQPRNMPIATDRDKQIIQQATAHVEPLTNSTTLRARILKAEEAGTKDAYWELQKDLREPGEISTKLLQFFQQDTDQAISFNYTLAAILRGEYLNEN